jgi:acetoin utilization deacetylase AcuC-like enzyme
MVIFYDPKCADYEAIGHPEAPFRVIRTAAALRVGQSAWTWRTPHPAPDDDILRAHSPEYLRRIETGEADFDADTPRYDDMAGHARRAAGSAVEAMTAALAGETAFSLMRPPGHHALRDRAMGFCYFNNIAIAALAARARGVERVVVWDFDAHHGNGTEAILHNVPGTFFVSIHQLPGWPGSGGSSFDNVLNFPVAPYAAAEEHMAALAESWQAVRLFKPDLVLVSAGFDAYVGDPITQMSLREEDFTTLGRWLGESGLPVAALLEGGYSRELPELATKFLTAWES